MSGKLIRSCCFYLETEMYRRTWVIVDVCARVRMRYFALHFHTRQAALRESKSKQLPTSPSIGMLIHLNAAFFAAMVVVYSLCWSKFESKFHKLPWKGFSASGAGGRWRWHLQRKRRDCNLQLQRRIMASAAMPESLNTVMTWQPLMTTFAPKKELRILHV